MEKVLVAITVSRDKDEIVYKLDCSTDLTSDELEYYLGKAIKGICKWKPSLCEENVKSVKAAVKKK